MKPLVTIGVCVRNCAPTIREAVESIIGQDYPRELMELIFVDDGSEDETSSIIEEYASKIDVRTKIFHTAWNGLGHARNLVVVNSEAEFILWVDGDMMLPKSYLKELLGLIMNDPKVGMVKGKQALQPGRNLLGTLETYSRAAGRMVNYRSAGLNSKALGTGGSIYRVEAILQAGKFDEDLRGYGEDWDVEIRAREKGWSLLTADVEFLDYERLGLTWKSLWKRYWLRGYHTRTFLSKNKGLIKHYRMFPPAAILSGLLHASTLFKLTHWKTVYLLPIQYFFKFCAWYVGFVKAILRS